MVRRREDVDCERSGANEARVVSGGVGQWNCVAGREDSVAGGGGVGGVGGGGARWRVGESDDGRGGDDNGLVAVHDGYNEFAVYIYDVYI